MPAHLVGATDAKRFRWAYDKFMATEAAQDDARKLSRDVRSAAVGEYLEAQLARRSGAFAGGIAELVAAAADALLSCYQTAKWAYVAAWARGPDGGFLRALFEDAQGLLERELAKLRASLKAVADGAVRKDVGEERALELRLRILNERDNLLSFRRKLCSAIERGEYDGGGGRGVR